mmetsp:Transcript_11482/g.38260  ORF Transcript_11482/g.38260 Transcript_11482/m.38260 type:complete len:202 (-) Transcript_11482:136-741(-)
MHETAEARTRVCKVCGGGQQSRSTSRDDPYDTSRARRWCAQPRHSLGQHLDLQRRRVNLRHLELHASLELRDGRSRVERYRGGKERRAEKRHRQRRCRTRRHRTRCRRRLRRCWKLLWLRLRRLRKRRLRGLHRLLLLMRRLLQCLRLLLCLLRLRRLRRRLIPRRRERGGGRGGSAVRGRHAADAAPLELRNDACACFAV